MSVCIIELNDIGITVYRQDKYAFESPGYAVVSKDGWLVGEFAFLQSRLNPTKTYTHFWERLDFNPLTRNTPHARHQADIAFAHLTHIWKQISSDTTKVIITVSGAYDMQQLGILLGIAQECSMPIVGIVDVAIVAASQVRVSASNVVYLDLQLHRTVITEIQRNGSVVRGDVAELEEAGLVQLTERWASLITDEFVRLTRFDPTRLAETDQQLHDRLPDWLAYLVQSGRCVLEMEHSGRCYSVRLSSEQFSDAVRIIYKRITDSLRRYVSSNGNILLLSHRFNRLPGFKNIASTLDFETVIQSKDSAITQGILEFRSQIESLEKTRLVTTLQIDSCAENPTTVSNSKATKERPTHVLYHGRVYAINESPLTIGTNLSTDDSGLIVGGSLDDVSNKHCIIYSRDDHVWIEDQSSSGTVVNGIKIENRVILNVNDTVRIGTPGEEMLLISIVGAHET